MSDGGFIGVFDSGLGGLSVWREIVRQLPHEQTLYLADQAHVPYGSRRLAEVQELVESSVRFLIKHGAKIVVIACNTASAAALHHLRRTFPQVPFVGMEPAIKPAIEQTRAGVVAVIATQATFQGKLFASLMERFAGDARVLTQACPGLVQAIESGALDTPETQALLRQYLSPLIRAGADQLVLGCTHYPFLRPAIERIVGESVTVIDPAPSVAHQTRRVLVQQKLAASQGRANRHLFYTSGDPTTFAAMVERLIPSVADGAAIKSARWRGGCLETAS